MTTTLPPVPSPIRIGLLGLNFGETIARRIIDRVPCLKLMAVCDLETEKVNAAAAKLGVLAYDQLDAMLANPEIEAVALFTGPIGRAALISKILKTGRHVLTTKPFEVDVTATQRVLDEASERNLIIHLNSPGPHPAEDAAVIQSWITDYSLGAPLAFRAETWANYREQANGSWYDDPQKCPAAPILRLGIYFLNDFAPFFGEARRAHVMQSRLFTGRPTVDHAQLSLEFENGALGAVFASFCVDDGQPWRDHITMNYERGTIRRWMSRAWPVNMPDDHALLELQRRDAPVIRAQTSPGAYAGWYQWEAFHEAIRGGKGLTSAQKASILYGVRLLDVMRASALSGQPELVGKCGGV